MSARLSPTGHRFASHIVGACFLLLVTVVAIAILQSGRVRRWFNPGQEIRIVLPQEGLFGLSAGAAVEILGTRAGTVERIVIDADQEIHAEIRIREDMRPFVRRDSQAYIRKQFGVAGDAYIEISRGFGQEMDWDFAVMTANVDKAPTETLQSILEELRSKAVPMVEEAHRALTSWADLGQRLSDPDGDVSRFTAALSDIGGRLSRGEGAIGRLLTSEELVDELEASFKELKEGVKQVQPIIEELKVTAANASKITGSLAERSDQLPEILKRLNDSLGSIQKLLKDFEEVTPKLPGIVDNIDDTTEQFPTAVLQLQQTLRELERLIIQTRSSWLLGGSKQPPAPDSRRIDPERVAP